MRRFLGLAACLLPLLWACDDRTAGGEDFPNSLETLARALERDVDSSEGWNPLDEATLALSDSALDDSVGWGAARAGALACLDTSGLDLLDGGWIRYSRTRCGALYASADTIEFRVDGSDTLLRRVVSDSIRMRDGARSLRILVDGDLDSGDGSYRRPLDSGTVLATLLRVSGRWTVVESLVVDAGPDLSWDTESDNRMRRATRTVLRSGDSLERWSLRPLLGVGSILGEGDSGLAILERTTWLEAATRRERGIVEVFGDGRANYPVAWSVAVVADAGDTLAREVRGPGDSGAFRPGDTAVFLERGRSGSDSVHLEASSRLGPDPRTDQDDSLLAFLVVRLRTSSRSERWTRLSFTADTPLPAGQTLRNGVISIEVRSEEGAWTRFEGRLNDGVAAGTWSRSDGAEGTAELGTDGSVISGP